MRKYHISYFNGSQRENGTCSIVIKKIIEQLTIDYLKVNEVVVHDLSSKENELKYCKGCLNCFNNGICNLNDAIDIVKENIIKSDLILIATPVYLNQVSGKVKNFLDRLASWTHLFRLIGKKCVIIVSSSSSGLNETLSYIYTILNYLGVRIVGVVDIESRKKIEYIDSDIKNIVERIIRSDVLQNERIPTFYQEQIFISYRKYMNFKVTLHSDDYEINYWKEHNYLSAKSLRNKYLTEISQMNKREE